MKLEFIVDLKDCKTTPEVLKVFYDVFKLPDNIDNLEDGNWDAFYDWFRNLDSDSEIVSNSPEKVSEVHLLIKNILNFKDNDKKGFNILADLMFGATDCRYPDYRQDNIIFSFTVKNDQ